MRLDDFIKMQEEAIISAEESAKKLPDSQWPIMVEATARQFRMLAESIRTELSEMRQLIQIDH